MDPQLGAEVPAQLLPGGAEGCGGSGAQGERDTGAGLLHSWEENHHVLRHTGVSGIFFRANKFKISKNLRIGNSRGDLKTIKTHL